MRDFFMAFSIWNSMCIEMNTQDESHKALQTTFSETAADLLFLIKWDTTVNYLGHNKFLGGGEIKNGNSAASIFQVLIVRFHKSYRMLFNACKVLSCASTNHARPFPS